MRWILLVLLSWVSVAQAADDAGKDVVLLIDRSVSTVSGARMRLGFERQLVEGETGVWVDPTGRWDSVGVALLAGGGLLGGGMGEAHAQAQRNGHLKPVRASAETDDRLRLMFERALRASVEAEGYSADRTVMAQDASSGYVPKAVTREGGLAVVLQRSKGLQPVSMSWDDRQVLLAFDVRRYRKGLDARGTPREQHARAVRYAGFPMPEAAKGADSWTPERTAVALSEIDAALRDMLAVAWVTTEVPDVPRGEIATVTVGGQPQQFRGRIWKEAGGLTYLFNHDEGITLVRTAALSPAG